MNLATVLPSAGLALGLDLVPEFGPICDSPRPPATRDSWYLLMPDGLRSCGKIGVLRTALEKANPKH